MALELRIQPRAQKDLARLSHDIRERIKHRVEAYAAAPQEPRHDVVPLVGSLSGYRLRVGEWRVMFAVADGRMDVTRVMHRREA